MTECAFWEKESTQRRTCVPAFGPGICGRQGGHTGPPLQNKIFESDIPVVPDMAGCFDQRLSMRVDNPLR